MPTIQSFLAAEGNNRLSGRFFRHVGAGLKPAPTRISQAPIVEPVYPGNAHGEPFGTLRTGLSDHRGSIAAVKKETLQLGKAKLTGPFKRGGLPVQTFYLSGYQARCKT